MHYSARHRLVHRPWVVWLAVCLALLGALASTLSHALQAERGMGLLEVCTTRGAQQITADSPNGQEPAPNSLAHCPFCLQPTDRAAPPPEPLPYLFLAQGGHTAPAIWQAFFFVAEFVLPTAPRGPPTPSLT
jgi:hypothetical protein